MEFGNTIGQRSDDLLQMTANAQRQEEEEVKESFKVKTKKQANNANKAAADKNNAEDLENEEDQLVNEIDSFLIEDDDI